MTSERDRPSGHEAARPRPTVWEILDRSLWGKPLGFIVVALGEAVLIAALVLVPALWAASLIEGIGYLSMGPWYGVLIGVVAAGVLGLSFLHSAATVRRPGQALLSRIGATPPAPGACRAAASALRDIQLASGIQPYPRLYVYPSPFPNGCSFCDWKGQLHVALSAAAAGSLGESELRAVLAHLVARAQAPASHCLLLAAGATDSFAGLDLKRLESTDLSLPWVVVAALGVALGALAFGGVGLSALALGIAAVLPALAVLSLAPRAVSWVSDRVRPGLDEWSDTLGMHYVKDPRGVLRAATSLLRSDNVAHAGPYDALFYAPTAWSEAVYASEQRRLDRLQALLGAEGLGVEAAPLAADSDVVRAAKETGHDRSSERGHP
ncbi:MAG: hypothetical protein QMD96_01905 [Anaerosomatales bacterium]|nr:hypothetical protein [Anaerosomatales bacterium]